MSQMHTVASSWVSVHSWTWAWSLRPEVCICGIQAQVDNHCTCVTNMHIKSPSSMEILFREHTREHISGGVFVKSHAQPFLRAWTDGRPRRKWAQAHSYVGEVLRCCAEGHVWVRFTNREGGLVGHMQRCIGGAWMWNVAKSACEWWI